MRAVYTLAPTPMSSAKLARRAELSEGCETEGQYGSTWLHSENKFIKFSTGKCGNVGYSMSSLLVKDVPEGFLRQLKIAALSQNKTLRQWVIDNLRKLVEKEGKHGND